MFNRFIAPLTLLTACASATSEGPAITTRTATTIAPQERIDLTHENVISAVEFTATKEQVWNALLEAHEALGSRMIASDAKALAAKFQLESKTGSLLGKPTANFIDCGIGSAGPRVNTYRVTVKITQAVESESVDRTRLLTVVEATARSPGMNVDPVQCTSLGSLEKRIIGLAVAQLN
jgi:hypothetical protein